MVQNDLIYVNVISRHMGHWAMFTAFQQAASYASQHGYRVMLSPHVGDSLVCRARQRSMHDFLKSEAGWYFTLDDDVAMPADTLVKLVEANKDMIGGLYRLKKGYVKEHGVAAHIALRLKDGHEFSLGQDEAAEVQYISGGCVMHKRKFVTDLIKAYPERMYVENETGEEICALYTPYIHGEAREYLSEDWAICQRAIDKGYEMYIHPNVLCEHWGLQKFAFGELSNKE